MSTAHGLSVSSSSERVPSSVLGMLLFVASELMFFAGLISAFTISRAGSTDAMWITPSAPLLPAAATAVNTTALMLSGLCVFVAYQQYRRDSPAAGRTLLAGWLLGAMFVVLQGREWVGLLTQGLTMYSSGLGAFFYLIVGVHALHAVAALIGLGIAWNGLRQGSLTPSFFLGAQTFWYFVVGVWPVIYLRMYF
jgi:heme/copper-type cytochrome/quinol oxidase subunit 3